MSEHDDKAVAMCCPTCGSQNGLRQWDHVWIVREEITLMPDGTVESYSAETDDVTQTFYACEDCGNRWDDAAQLREHFLRTNAKTQAGEDN